MVIKYKLLALLYLGLSMVLGYSFKNNPSEYYLFVSQTLAFIIAILYIYRDLKK